MCWNASLSQFLQETEYMPTTVQYCVNYCLEMAVGLSKNYKQELHYWLWIISKKLHWRNFKMLKNSIASKCQN